jgi:hypothetical protein
MKWDLKESSSSPKNIETAWWCTRKPYTEWCWFIVLSQRRLQFWINAGCSEPDEDPGQLLLVSDTWNRAYMSVMTARCSRLLSHAACYSCGSSSAQDLFAAAGLVTDDQSSAPTPRARQFFPTEALSTSPRALHGSLLHLQPSLTSTSVRLHNYSLQLKACQRSFFFPRPSRQLPKIWQWLFGRNCIKTHGNPRLHYCIGHRSVK